jgi:hypothetical protein
MVNSEVNPHKFRYHFSHTFLGRGGPDEAQRVGQVPDSRAARPERTQRGHVVIMTTSWEADPARMTLWQVGDDRHRRGNQMANRRRRYWRGRGCIPMTANGLIWASSPSAGEARQHRQPSARSSKSAVAAAHIACRPDYVTGPLTRKSSEVSLSRPFPCAVRAVRAGSTSPPVLGGLIDEHTGAPAVDS